MYDLVYLSCNQISKWLSSSLKIQMFTHLDNISMGEHATWFISFHHIITWKYNISCTRKIKLGLHIFNYSSVSLSLSVCLLYYFLALCGFDNTCNMCQQRHNCHKIDANHLHRPMYTMYIEWNTFYDFQLKIYPLGWIVLCEMIKLYIACSCTTYISFPLKKPVCMLAVPPLKCYLDDFQSNININIISH